jgi:hypothetical protein
MDSNRFVPDPRRRLNSVARSDGSTFMSITCDLASELADRFEGDAEDMPKLSHLMHLAQHLNESGLTHETDRPALTNPALVAQLAGLPAIVERLMSDLGR